MPKPFPLPYTIGIDICQISRISSLLTKSITTRRRFLERVFTSRERKVYSEILQPRLLDADERSKTSESLSTAWVINQSGDSGQVTRSPTEAQTLKISTFIAGRWAAKEAVMKAYRHRRVLMQEIQILRMESSGDRGASEAPVCVVKSAARDVDALGGHRDHDERGREEVLNASEEARLWDEGDEVQISISHDGDYATAVAMVVEKPILLPFGGARV